MNNTIKTLIIISLSFSVAFAQNVGIGTNTPNVRLTIKTNGTDYIQFRDSGGDNEWHIRSQGAGNADLGFTETGVLDNRLVLRAGGNVGIGVALPSERLSVYTGQDVSAEIGYAHVGYVGHDGFAGFSHIDNNGTESYALLQSSGGTTFLNAASGQNIYFRINNTTYMTMESTGIIDIDKGVRFDCDGCGSTSTLNGSSDWGDLTIQGRVLSGNQNIHLSPPGGSNVIINDTYRAAGGSTGSGGAGLTVQARTDAKGGLRTERRYYYYARYHTANGTSYDDNLGAWDFCASAGGTFHIGDDVFDGGGDNLRVSRECTVYISGHSTTATSTINHTYDTRPTWHLYSRTYTIYDTGYGQYCRAICVNFDY